MKKLINLFVPLLLSLINLSHAQSLDPVVQEGRQWFTQFWCSVNPAEYNPIHTETYRMEGDTVINQLTYKKIYCYKTPDLSDRQLLHYTCRQDNQKVFIYFYHTQSEVLFFDFSLTNGDLFEEYGRSYQVFYIHDTLLNDGVTRKCIHLKDTTRDDNIKIWVEGIGSLHKGIYWEPFDIVGCTATLLYCQQNGVQIYLNLDAQEPAPSPWFPDGAEWYYSTRDNNLSMNTPTHYIHMTVAKDTLFAGRLCKQLKFEACDGTFETLYEYVYPCGDSLFYYNYADEDFFLLLDLSAKTGDTVWVHRSGFIPNPGFDPYRHWEIGIPNPNDIRKYYRFMAYKITTIDTVTMGGKTLRRQRAEAIHSIKENGEGFLSAWLFPSVSNSYNFITEGIGSMGGFWGQDYSAYMTWLRCFFAEGKTYMTDGTCTNAAVETPLENPAAFWRLSPQPATEHVQAVCEAAETGWHSGLWRLVDTGGKALRRGTFSDGRFDVSLSAIPAGLYFIEITANGTTCRLKCVKR